MDGAPTQIMCFCEARCGKCGPFALPDLSEFSYGQFVLDADRGRQFAYLNGPTEPAWQVIQELVKEHPDGPSLSSAQIQSLVAECCDPVDGKKWNLGGEPVCTFCGAAFVSRGGKVLYKEAIPVARFKTFLSLPMQEKKDKLAALISSLPKDVAILLVARDQIVLRIGARVVTLPGEACVSGDSVTDFIVHADALRRWDAPNAHIEIDEKTKAEIFEVVKNEMKKRNALVRVE